MIDYLLGKHETVYATIALAALVSAAAVITYGRLAFEEGSMRMFWPRVAMALGATLLALRFWLSLALGQEVHVPPLALASLGMFFCGYCVVQLRSIKRAIIVSRVNLKCFRDPELPCQREDRLKEAAMIRQEKK